MIQLYTGDGKGKTTAAVGLAVRATGCGLRVIFSQFMKGNDTGELHVLEGLSQVTILRSPKEFGFYCTLGDEEKAELAQIHDDILDRILEAVQEHQCDMVILDEITYPVSWELVSVEKLKKLLLLAGKTDETGVSSKAAEEKAAGGLVLRGLPELILTGRDAVDFITDQADYITEMKAVRHPFEKGVGARKGIEY